MIWALCGIFDVRGESRVGVIAMGNDRLCDPDFFLRGGKMVILYDVRCVAALAHSHRRVVVTRMLITKL